MTETYFLDTSQFTYTYTYYFSFGSLQIYSDKPIRQLHNNFYFYSPRNRDSLHVDASLAQAKMWFSNVLGNAEYLCLQSGTDIIWKSEDCRNWRKNEELSTSMIEVWTDEYGGNAIFNFYDRSFLGISPDPVPSASAAAGDPPAAQTEGAVISSDLSSKLDVISSSIGSLNLSVALLLFILIFKSVISLR